MEKNREKFKIIKMFNFLRILDNIYNCCADIWRCCCSEASIGEPPLIITKIIKLLSSVICKFLNFGCMTLG